MYIYIYIYIYILGMCEFKILSSNRIEFIKFRIESNRISNLCGNITLLICI